MQDYLTLAFDTTTPELSVALQHQGQIFVQEPSLKPHADSLVPAVLDLLQKHQLAFEALDFLAVSRGPGSFTGTRIGLATAQGFKLAAPVRCFAPTTLEVMAFAGAQQLSPHCLPEVILLSLIADNRGSYYGQLYDGALEVKSKAKLWQPQEIAAFLEENQHNYAISSKRDNALKDLKVLQSPLAVVIINYLRFRLLHALILPETLQPFYLLTPHYAPHVRS